MTLRREVGQLLLIVAAAMVIALTGCSSAPRSSEPSGSSGASPTAGEYALMPTSLLNTPEWRFNRRPNTFNTREELRGDRVWVNGPGIMLDLVVVEGTGNASTLWNAAPIEQGVTPYGAVLIEGLWRPEGGGPLYPYGRMKFAESAVFVATKFGDPTVLRAFLNDLVPVSKSEWTTWIASLPGSTCQPATSPNCS